MPILVRRLALATCVLLIGSTADAAPKMKPTAKLVHEATGSDDPISMGVEEEDEEEEEEEEEEVEQPVRKKRTHATKKQVRQAAETDEVDLDDSELDEPLKVEKRRSKRTLRDWHLAVGPNVWLSSVQANVAVGDKSITAAVDFMAISHYTKFAAPLIAEGRYKRFSFVGDMTYAVVGIEGGNELGPLDLALTGNVSSLQFDGLGGYRVYGKDDSKFSAEVRAGLRYSRMAISGTVMLSGSELEPKQIVSGSSDLLLGARVFAKPWKRVFASAAVDQSVVGTSDSMWSLAGEANFRVGGYVLLTAGYKTMVQRSGSVTQTMFGPKFSVQVLF
jgi:hypothetical protein